MLKHLISEEMPKYRKQQFYILKLHMFVSLKCYLLREMNWKMCLNGKQTRHTGCIQKIKKNTKKIKV